MKENFAQNSSANNEPRDIVDICQLACTGNEDARRKLMELLFDRIYKTASYLAQTKEDAEDLAQTACEEVLASAGTFRGESSIKYWADRITLHTASKILKKKTRRKNIFKKYYQSDINSNTVDELAEKTKIQDRLFVLIKNLKLNHREILVLRYVYGYTVSEVADMLAIPFETARGRLKKGRARLKKGVIADPVLKEWIKEWI